MRLPVDGRRSVGRPARCRMAFAPRPPVVLTFLAPADRCNQRCPSCLIDMTGEPVRSFVLSPEDYAAIVTQFVTAGIPLLAVSFQGFEVTLPRSWLYVEATFREAQKHQVRRSFITNGMLLDRHTDQIIELEPARISVSLDGSTPEANDPIRGLPGAFDATVRSIRRFLAAAPQFASAMSIVSTVFSEDNVRSLLQMPPLLASLGIPRWAAGFELGLQDGIERPVQHRDTLKRWIESLSEAADRHRISFHTNDEFGLFSENGANPAPVRAKQLFHPDFIVRVEPTGHVRVGRELLAAFDERTTRRWTPDGPSIIEVIGYEERARRFADSR